VNIEVKGLDATLKKFERLATQSKGDIQAALNDFADRTSSDAKSNLQRNATSNEGKLSQAIQPFYGDLEAGVKVNINYAAYVEFGTRKMAAQYLGSLPNDWQNIANQYKGGNGGSIKGILYALRQWFIDRKIPKEKQFFIARKILTEGIKPKPYLFPAFRDNIPQLKKDIQAIFK